MADNFLGEIPEFFLKDRTFTSFISKKEDDPTFGMGNVKDKIYGMRISMYRSMARDLNVSVTSSAGVRYFPPQDLVTGSLRETMTMYSRPSAFGPPSLGFTTVTASTLGHFESSVDATSDDGFFHPNRTGLQKYYEVAGDKAL